MERRRGPGTSPIRLALAIVAVAIAVTLIVAWLLGAFRSTPPQSTAFDTPPTARPTLLAATPTPATATPSASVSSPPDPVLVGAGDIARCDGSGDEATADLVSEIDGIVFTLGDNAYPDGSARNFRECYEPSWGRFRDRTRLPAPGNHDYETADARGYRAYFGDLATPDGTTWYSRDVGAWHVVVLDANCDRAGVGCGPDSTQLRWLRADLAASDARCTLALWHQPRFSSGYHGSDPAVGPFWDALYDAGADLVLNGHDHDYERFAPQDPSARPDPSRGITEIVAGAGGGERRPFEELAANSVARFHRGFGVLQLTLHDDGWSSRFVPVDGSFSDDVEGVCH